MQGRTVLQQLCQMAMANSPIQMMRVLVFSVHKPVVGVGGNLQCLGNQTPALQEPGHAVHLVLHHSNMSGKSSRQHLQSLGLLLLDAAPACEQIIERSEVSCIMLEANSWEAQASWNMLKSKWDADLVTCKVGS